MTRFPPDSSIVVTGGAGFLGRAIVARLGQLGYRRVHAPRSRDYDLTTERDVERMYVDLRPDVVIHAAGRVGGILANRTHPGEFYYRNLIMATLLLEHARRNGVAKYVGVSSICAYPKITPIPFREENLWEGYPDETMAPYGLAKRMMIVQAQAYREEYGFNAITLLPVNLYGPHDDFDPDNSHVVAALIRKFVEAVERGLPTVTVWGDGSPTREFLYVDDAAKAICLATERYDGPEPVNVGSSHELSIRDLAEQVAQVTGFRGTLEWDTSKPNGQPRRKLDVSRAEALFGFRSRTSFAEGLARTVEWYWAQRVVGLAV
jgi:GDP-L-fucose synthase